MTLELFETVETSLTSAYDAPVPAPGCWPLVGDSLWSVWYLRTGRAVVEWEGGSLRLSPGHWAVVPPDFPRSQRFAAGSHIVSVRFSASWPHGRPLFTENEVLRVPAKSWASLEEPAVRLVDLVGGSERQAGMETWRLRRRPLDGHWELRGAFAGFLARWYRLMVEAGRHPTAPAPGDPRLGTALAVLDELPIAGTVPYDDLLAATGLSRVHLDRLFVRDLGATPKTWLDQRRLDEARRLLHETDEPLKAIARDLAFTDVSHLCRWYRAHTGETPGKARRQPVHPLI